MRLPMQLPPRAAICPPLSWVHVQSAGHGSLAAFKGQQLGRAGMGWHTLVVHARQPFNRPAVPGGAHVASARCNGTVCKSSAGISRSRLHPCRTFAVKSNRDQMAAEGRPNVLLAHRRRRRRRANRLQGRRGAVGRHKLVQRGAGQRAGVEGAPCSGHLHCGIVPWLQTHQRGSPAAAAAAAAAATMRPKLPVARWHRHIVKHDSLEGVGAPRQRRLCSRGSE